MITLTDVFCSHHARSLAEVLLHKLGADDADEGGGRVVRNRLGEHRLPGAGRAVEEHAARRVDPDLLVEVALRERQLHRLADLLLLDVHAADVRVRDVRPLGVRDDRDGRVGLGREHVDERVRVAVERDRGGGAEELAVERREDAHVVVGARRRADDAGRVVDHLEELADHERDRLRVGGVVGWWGGGLVGWWVSGLDQFARVAREANDARGWEERRRRSGGGGRRSAHLDALDLLLGAQQLVLQALLLLLDVLLLRGRERKSA
jgi:hypothetical protein